MDWFLYDTNTRHERVSSNNRKNFLVGNLYKSELISEINLIVPSVHKTDQTHVKLVFNNFVGTRRYEVNRETSVSL